MALAYYTEEDVLQRLTFLPEWQLKEGALERTFTFADFPQAFAFMSMVAMAAEKANHHPEWSNTYDRVTVRWVTHDAGGVTDKDLQLAATCDRLFS